MMGTVPENDKTGHHVWGCGLGAGRICLVGHSLPGSPRLGL